MSEHTLSLTADEVMALSDRVRNDERGTEEMCLSAYPLLLKLGSLFVDLVGSGTKQSGELPIVCTEAELWLMRGKIITGDKTASDPLFGVKLLTKIYRGLLALNAPGDLPLADCESPFDRAQTIERLKGWAERKEPEP